MGKQYTTYTYTGSPSSQYVSASSDSGATDNTYSATAYQNGAHLAPQVMNSFGGYSNMAIAKPYTYYLTHPGEASSGALQYQGARNEDEGRAQGLQTESQGSNVEHPPDSSNLKAVNRAFSPSNAITGSAERSLLDIISPPETAPTGNAFTSSITSPVSSFLNNARVQLSFSGGYPSNSPRYTYLTFIIPGDLCTVTPQEVAGSGSSIDVLKSLTTANGFVNQPVAYGSTYSTSYSAPGSLAAGYDASGNYHYTTGSAVQSQATYSNGPTIGMFAPLQVGSQPFAGGPTGGIIGAAGAGTFLNAPGVRSLDDHVPNAEDSTPPPTQAPSSGNTKPNEAFTPGSRSVNQ